MTSFLKPDECEKLKVALCHTNIDKFQSIMSTIEFHARKKDIKNLCAFFEKVGNIDFVLSEKLLGHILRNKKINDIHKALVLESLFKSIGNELNKEKILGRIQIITKNVKVDNSMDCVFKLRLIQSVLYECQQSGKMPSDSEIDQLKMQIDDLPFDDHDLKRWMKMEMDEYFN